MDIKTQHLANTVQIENATDVAFNIHDVPAEYSTTHHYAFTLTINPNNEDEVFIVEWYLATTTYANNMAQDSVVTWNDITLKGLSPTQQAKLAIVHSYIEENPESLFQFFN